MSAVRMCDRCGTIFSERAEGWGTGSITVTKTVDGRRKALTETIDICPADNSYDGAPLPQLAAAPVAGGDAADRLADTIPQES